jgi:hypothetical protein
MRRDAATPIVETAMGYGPHHLVNMLTHALTSHCRTAQDLPYGQEGVLGLAPSWTQAAAVLPSPADDFDWEGDRPLNLPREDLVIYEMHVRGFTWSAGGRVSAPGDCQET